MNPPAIIQVRPDPVPCDLPAPPEPVQVVGMAAADGIYVTKTDVANLAAYLVGIRGWVRAAAICLGQR